MRANKMNMYKTILLLLLFASMGCSQKPMNYYYLNPNDNLTTVGRVTIIELVDHSNYPQVSGDITNALYQELQKKQVFGLTAINQKDPRWKSLQLNVDSEFTIHQLDAIQKQLHCNAILVGTITEYQPYPHMSIGLRLKLVDVSDGRLLWALEQIWDSADKTTETRIEKYFKNQMGRKSAGLRQELVSVSSLKFTKFVAYEVAKTLQPGELY